MLVILISPAAVVGQNLSEDPGGAGDLVFLTEQAPPFNYMDNGTAYINPVVAGLYYKTTYYRLADGSDGRQYIVCCGKYRSQEHDRRAG